jgi:hypothetical protein
MTRQYLLVTVVLLLLFLLLGNVGLSPAFAAAP